MCKPPAARTAAPAWKGAGAGENRPISAHIAGPLTGAAASYAFKMYGGTMTVTGGTFGQPPSGSTTNSGSGAFVMGLDKDNKATATIEAGTFVVSSGNSGGQAGFSVYHYAEVTFGKEGSQEGPTLTGLAAGLVAENASAASTITIHGGTFRSTRDSGNSDGIWFSNLHAQLTVNGGTFTGEARAGIYFENSPSYSAGWPSNGEIPGTRYIDLRGGIFQGAQGGIMASSNNKYVGVIIDARVGENSPGGYYVIDCYSDINSTNPVGTAILRFDNQINSVLAGAGRRKIVLRWVGQTSGS